MDAGQEGEIGPLTISLMASALSLPVAMITMERAFMIEPIPIVRARRGNIISAGEEALVGLNRALRQLNDVRGGGKCISGFVECNMSVAADAKNLKIYTIPQPQSSLHNGGIHLPHWQQYRTGHECGRAAH